jgi:hypothetical protein
VRFAGAIDIGGSDPMTIVQVQIAHQQKLIEQLQSRLTRLEINRQRLPGHSAARSGMKNTRLK